MIGSIPINIGTVESVMMTSVEETSPPTSPMTKEVDSFTTSPNVLKTPEKIIQKGKVKAIVCEKNRMDLTTQFEENSVKKVKSSGLRIPQVNLGPLFDKQNREHDDEESTITTKDCPTMGLTVDDKTKRNVMVRYKGPITRSKARMVKDTPLTSQMELSAVDDDSESRKMPVLVTGTTSTEEQGEQIRELRRMLAEKEAEVARLSVQLQENMGVGQSSGVGQTSAPQIPQAGLRTEIRQPADPIPQPDLRTLIMEGIREYQAAMCMPVLGYRKPYPAHYDQIPFPRYYCNNQ